MVTISTPRGIVGYDEAGSGDPPIIFLHGVGSDRSVWKPQLDHFGQARRSVAFDYPGYGDSEFVDGATRDDFAASALAAMDSLSISRAHVCGLSLGGVIAIAMHAQAPDRIISLVLADTFAVHPDGDNIYQRSVAASQSMTMAELAEARTGILFGSTATPELRQEVREVMGAIDPRAYLLGAEAVWLADQRDRVSRVRCPTLVLVGDEDVVTPPGLSEELTRLVPGSILELVRGAGHLTNAEQPAQFNRAIESFLSRQR